MGEWHDFVEIIFHRRESAFSRRDIATKREQRVNQTSSFRRRRIFLYPRLGFVISFRRRQAAMSNA